MKIAICISGEMRLFNNQKLIDSFNKFKGSIPFDIDVFVSTWSHIGFSYNTKRISPLLRRDDIHNMRNDIVELFNPVSLEIENYDDWLDDNSNMTSIMSNSLIGGESVTSPPQLYKIYKCNELKKKYEIENNFKYDVVIRTRPDLLYLSDLDLSDINSINHINFGINGSYYPNRIFDIFFYSNSENMDKICSSWLSIISDINFDFDNGLDKRDCCRLLYINCIKNKIAVNDLDRRICAVYRNEPIDLFYKEIKRING
jgi:hypothetical protein